MAGRYDSNPFDEDEVNPFSDPLVRAQAAGKKTSYGGGFYDSVSIPCPQSA
jgi:hypothetical protein